MHQSRHDYFPDSLSEVDGRALEEKCCRMAGHAAMIRIPVAVKWRFRKLDRRGQSHASQWKETLFHNLTNGMVRRFYSRAAGIQKGTRRPFHGTTHHWHRSGQNRFSFRGARQPRAGDRAQEVFADSTAPFYRQPARLLDWDGSLQRLAFSRPGPS